MLWHVAYPCRFTNAFRAVSAFSELFDMLLLIRAFCVGSDIDIRVLKGYGISYINPHLQLENSVLDQTYTVV